MAGNSVNQNPRNKAGRYSGAGEAGVTRLVPTEREARRGLEPIQIGEEGRWSPGLALGLGALALLGAGVATFVARRARRPKGLRPRLERMVGLR